MFDFYMERGVFPEVNTGWFPEELQGASGERPGSSKGSVEQEPHGCAPACPLEKLIPVDYKDSPRRWVF